MLAAASQTGGAGRWCAVSLSRSIPRRIALGCVWLLALAWWPGAQAASLFRCTGAGGEVVFTSTAAGYHGCHRLAVSAQAGQRKAADAPRAAAGRVAPRSGRRLFEQVIVSMDTSARTVRPSKPPSLERVRGSVLTDARAIDAPPAVRPKVALGRWTYSDTSPEAGKAVSAAADADRVLRGAVYRVVQRDGSVEYTNVHPGRTQGRAVTTLFTYIATCMACNLHSPIHWGSVRLNVHAYAQIIRAASVQYGVDEAFLRAIIHAESAFNPRALSLKGAQGLMQLMPGTASDMGVSDAFDAEQNIRGGARYLSGLLRSFGGDERLAAAAYNAGPGAVTRYHGVPPYAETQVYVERVGTLRRRYGRAPSRSLAASRGVGGAL